MRSLRARFCSSQLRVGEGERGRVHLRVLVEDLARFGFVRVGPARRVVDRRDDAIVAVAILVEPRARRKPAAHEIAVPDAVEWMSDDAHLICPVLVERDERFTDEGGIECLPRERRRHRGLLKFDEIHFGRIGTVLAQPAARRCER